jgi:DNA-binding CsgD family transcriptional regulator
MRHPDPPPGLPDAHPPALVGRAREQATLRAALADALAGHGHLVLIGGEAGIGKTALAEEVLHDAASQGALGLIGRCYDLAETPPYGPWRELFTRRVQDGDPSPLTAAFTLDGTGTPVASQVALFAQAADFLVAQAARRPLVLLLDDLHWADPASLDLLRVMARRLGEIPILVLATYRADELSQRHPLEGLLPALVREARALRLDLRPLADEALADLARQRYGLIAGESDRLVEYLSAQSEGNPFYIGEVLRTLEDEGVLDQGDTGWRLGDLRGVRVPPLLRQVINGRVARLGERPRHLLALAAVIGQVVPLDLWAVVAETAEEVLLEAIERAVEAHLLIEAPAKGGYRFPHALIRQALYDGVLLPRRRAWHRRVGEVLAPHSTPDPDAVAYHFQQAGDARAASWLIQAGERAQRAYAWLTAAERYEAALALTEAGSDDPAQRAVLLLTVAQLRRYTDPARGLPLAAEAERLALAAGDRVLAAAACFDHGHLQCLSLNVQAGVAEMEAALPALAGLTPAERARLPTLRILGVAPEEDYHRGAFVLWLNSAGRYREALAHAEPAARRAPGTTARALQALGLAGAMLGQPGEWRRAYADSRAAFLAAGQHREVAILLSQELTMAVHYHGDEPAYLARLADESERAERLASGVVVGVAPRLGGMALLWLTGRWAEARAAAQEATGMTNPHESTWRHARPWLGHILRAQGEPERAWLLIQDMVPGGPLGAPITQLHNELAMGQVAVTLALDAADLLAARAWLDAHDRWLAWSGAVLGQAEGHLGWAAYHRAAGDPALAQQHAERALAHATAPRQPAALLAAHRLLGELATTASRHAEAAAHLDRALALADACAAPYERALTLLALAELRLATGSHPDAQAALDEARPVLLRLEARPALARGEALAARIAARPPAPPARPTAPAGLTAREVEVLRLLVRGATDPAIARELSISVKTVNKHVASILGKTGSPNRTAAAAFALRNGLG